MPVTNSEIKMILSYLIGSQVITAVQDQEDAWYDYLTHEFPDLEGNELRPAARYAIKDWAAHDRAWRVDVAHFARAIKTLRQHRVHALRESVKFREPPRELRGDASKELTWKKTLVACVGRAVPTEQAVEQAWSAVGGRPPVELPSRPASESGQARARAVIQALVTDSRRPD